MFGESCCQKEKDRQRSARSQSSLQEWRRHSPTGSPNSSLASTALGLMSFVKRPLHRVPDHTTK